MLFKDKLNDVAPCIQAEFKELFDLALEKQGHPMDLLIIGDW